MPKHNSATPLPIGLILARGIRQKHIRMAVKLSEIGDRRGLLAFQILRRC